MESKTAKNGLGLESQSYHSVNAEEFANYYGKGQPVEFH